MQKCFENWVIGTLEDSPIPHEVKNIYFCLHKDNAFSYLSFGGNEFASKNLFNFWFYPLDAQFFNLNDISQTFNLTNLRKLIEKALHNPQFYQHFHNKQIYFGNFFSNDIYKIN